ncbi:MAG: DUF433 domain-containing protein [Bacteroidota bacterium]
MENYMQHIEIDTKVMFGKPVIKGTRITVELVLDELGAGKMMDDLLAAHPRLGKEAIWAALKFAADALRGERSYPVAV